ncbi:amidohydrolase family protein [Fundidesulfovibrio agrisoli]|uniref:amidohydrolase family protein n=1 Tax=Fundidesulfovibrio agrisoli TaxID=2922717 RepID=UPI001FAB8A47
MKIDIHAHAFHPKIAGKAVRQLNEHYDIKAVGDGTPEDLLRRLAAAGIDRAAVHAAATTPAQVIPANNWAMELARKYPALIPFGTVHPGYADNAKELDRLERAGIRGIKIHADFQGFRLDDPALRPVMAALEGRFVTIFHVGDRLPPDKNPSCPIKLAAIHREFPGLTIIAAHLGGLMHWEEALEHLAGKDVYLDTSSSLPFIQDATLRAILDRHPAERVLFGSDYPLYDPGVELERLRTRLGLADADLERLLTTAQSLFPGLDEARMRASA